MNPEELIRSAGVSHTPGAVVDSLEAAQAAAEALDAPLWVRAAGGSCDAFCMLVEHKADMRLAFAKARNVAVGNAILVQRAIGGEVYRVVGRRTGHAFELAGIFRQTMLPGLFRVPMAYVTPCGLEKGPRAALHDLAARTGAEAALGPGWAEFEWVFSESGPVLTYVEPKPGPDPLLGELLRLASVTQQAAAVCWMHAGSGVVVEVTGISQAGALPGVERVVVQAAPGDTLGHIVDARARDRIGYVIAAGPAPGEAMDTARRACCCIEVVTRPASD